MHYLHCTHLKIPMLHWMVWILGVELRMSVTCWCVGSRDRLCEYLLKSLCVMCDSGTCRISKFAVTPNANVAVHFSKQLFS